MKKFLLFTLLLSLFLSCSQCTAIPLLYTVDAKSAPSGDNSDLLQANPSNQSAPFQATLYFRLAGQPLLASEIRQLVLYPNESIETALIRELILGPSSDQPALERVLPQETRLVKWSSADHILYLTFGNEWLNPIALPTDWKQDPVLSSEIPLQRLLLVQSVVATITENLPYTAVQFLFQDDVASGLDPRMQMSFFLQDEHGIADPQYRIESLLLSPYTLASQILQAWQKRDYQTLYAHIGMTSNVPIYSSFCAQLEEMQTLVQYSLSPGTVSQNGQTAIVTLSYFAHNQETIVNRMGYPLRLYQQNGLWKISYDTLLQLLGVIS